MMSKSERVTAPSVVPIVIGILASLGCAPVDLDYVDSDGTVSDRNILSEDLADDRLDSELLAGARDLSSEELNALGIEPSESCFGGSLQHAHSGGVARERLVYAFCDSGRASFSIDLTDTLCDNRSARVSWKIYDSVGLLGSGSGTNGNGCNQVRSFGLGDYFSDIERIHTELKACNTFGCSSTEAFDDYP